jgi:hypothetical protein
MSDAPRVEPSHYNYAVLPPDSDRENFARFIGHLPVGRKAPGFEAVRLDDGTRVRLPEYWRKGICVLEVGALT